MIKHDIGVHGSEVWYKDNKIHKENKPAMTLPNGSEIWYKDSKRHRINGPAVNAPMGLKCGIKIINSTE